MIIGKRHERARVVKGYAFSDHPPHVLVAITQFLASGDTAELAGTPYGRADDDYSIYLDPPPRKAGAARRWLRSPCCGAAVVGMVDVTVHPRFYEDGTAGRIVDTLAALAAEAATQRPDGPYCQECGGPVAVPGR